MSNLQSGHVKDHTSIAHSTAECHSWPDAYQRPLCCLAWDGVSSFHACQLDHPVHREREKSLSKFSIYSLYSSIRHNSVAL